MHGMSPYHGFHGRPLEVFDPFSLYFWDPFHHEFACRAPFMMPRPPMLPHMGPMHSHMGSMSSLMGMGSPMLSHMAGVPKTKIEHKETPEAHLFRAELPGVRKEDVKVQVEDGCIVHISAKRGHDVEERKDNYHHVERGFGAFVTKFKLPNNTKPQHISSTMDNGVLIVTIPKDKVDRVEQPQCY